MKPGTGFIAASKRPTPTVELIYDGDCPNVDAARRQLRRAIAGVGLPPRWREWRGDDPASPARVRGYGSPTILVDGEDVAPAGDSAGACCRVYARPGGSLAAVPSVDAIASALRAAVAGWPRASGLS